jgi:F-type H+-transporting ATPase subunit b
MFFFAEVDQSSWINSIFDFRSNFINWLLLVGLIWWGCDKYLGAVFVNRQKSIESRLTDAAQAKEAARQLVADHQAMVLKADKDIEAIVTEARESAEKLARRLEEQTRNDIEELRKKIEAASAMERQLAISEMRAIAAKTALRLAEESLSKNLSAASQTQLLNQFVEQLDQISGQEELAPPQQFERIH